ncbi:MAG: preprotein translocase subunit SecY [Armatimonadetes bacterium]|nr:preprotein translocase subunit SecY [Armatimonadota bacterium]
MLASVLAAFRVPDLRKRITFVFGMFAVYVVGLHIPVAVSGQAFERLAQAGGLIGLLDAFTGGAFKKFTIFALGIIPYINASIIMQLLTIAIPQLEQLAKEGEPGQKKIRLWTRWMTGGLAIVQASGMTLYLRSAGVEFAGPFQIVQVVISLAAGTAFLMWLGELITDKGIGNGVSLIIFAGIMASLPFQLAQIATKLQAGSIHWYNAAGLLIAFVLTVMAIVAVTQAQRKIPIQHVKKVVGNKVYGGQSSYLPLKVNSAGVIPIIFAISLQYFPLTIAQFLPQGTWLGSHMKTFAERLIPTLGHPEGMLVYAALVVFFTYFYTAVTFNVPEVAENLKKWGSFIPGIRPGKPTMEYLDKVMTRITLAGAVFLALIALAQFVIPEMVGVTGFTLVGGTSLLIVVGVALETMQAIESQMLMRHYEGFIK